MRNKLIGWVCLLVMCAMALGGCHGFFPKSKSIDTLAVVSVLGVDAHEEGVLLTAVMRDYEGGEDAEGKTLVLSASAASLAQALDKLQMYSDKEVFLGLTDFYLFGEGVRSGVQKYMDFLSREISLKVNSAVFFVEGRASDFVKAHNSDYYLHSRLQNLSQNTSFSGQLRGLSFLQMMSKLEDTEVFALAVPCLKTINVERPAEENASEGEQESTKNEADLALGYAVLQNGRETFFLHDETVLGWAFATAHTNYLCFDIKDEEENSLVFKTTRVKTRVKVYENEGKLQKIELIVKVSSTLSESHSPLDITKSEAEAYIKRAQQEKIKQQILATISIAQQNQADFLGVGELIRHQNPRLWQRISSDYATQFAQAEWDIVVKPELKRTHNLLS